MLNRLRIEEGWFTLLLTWGLVIIAAAAIVNADLISGLDGLPLIATLAVLTGVLLSKSSFSGRTAHLMALIYGLFLVTVMIGRTMPDDMLWSERAFDLVNRQLIWLSKAVSQGSSRDGLIFVIHTSAVFWLLGYTASWYTFRNPKIWRVILPSGLVLLSVIYYYYGPKPLVAYLALYTLVALIYIARTHLVAREKIWRSEAVRYESNIRFTFLRSSILVALIALAIAWGIPAAQASDKVSNVLGETGVSDTWRGFQDTWTRLFSSLRSYGTATTDPFRSTLSLGGPRTVTDALVMDVYVDEQIPYVYWQAVAYDTYQNGGWSITSDTSQVLHLPDEGPVGVTDYLLRENIDQTFINYIPNSGTIYAAPEVMQSDRQIILNRSLDDQGREIVHSVQSRFVLRQGDRYEVTSNYGIADAGSLRKASQSYPNWITERYLQVPEEITPETRALAEELTQGLTNPFDKAIAIRNYLRQNISYNDQIAAPPDGVEPVHYVLFDSQEAYCNYYASSMIMMLRSVGVPSRFVAGYTQGEWDDESRSYRVRSSNAHAWTEVFFPRFGWIPFEATASIPSGDRPETFDNPGDAFGNETAPNELDNATDGQQPEELTDAERLQNLLEERDALTGEGAGTQSGNIALQAGIAGTLLAITILAIFMAGRANSRVEANVARSYTRLSSWAPWLGVLINPSQTPYERASMLGTAVPEGRDPLRKITYQFVRQQFSQARAADPDFDPRQEWKILRPKMIRRTISFQLQRFLALRPKWRKDRQAK